jgi:uncharacterized repeat protein (TIGR01451 family)
VNVDHSWLGTSGVRVRALAAGLVLLAAGGMVLGGSRSRHLAADAAANPASIPGRLVQNQNQAEISPRLFAPAASRSQEAAQSQARSLFASLPLSFEPNQGQANLDPADPRARFVARGSGYSLILGSEGAILNLSSKAPRSPDPSRHEAALTRIETLRMKLAGANPNATVSASDPLPGKSNYIVGNDPAKWRRQVPQFARVRYQNIYPGINLVFYGNQGRLEYDFQVAPGCDPAQAELEFDGARQLELIDGALVVHATEGSVRLESPRVYQEIAGRQQPVEGSFVLRGPKRAGFAIGPYDRSRQLVIDPLVNFSTYFGGALDEQNTSVALDGSGNIYLTGSTNSPNLATTGVYQTTLRTGARNVYIAKISPPLGSTPPVLQYVTYLGGSGSDFPVGIAVDAGGDPFVAGTTTSIDFPTTQTAYQTAPDGGPAGTPHVFVTELNPTATAPLTYSSYLSGNGDDVATGMTIDAHGYIYVTGTTTSVETLTTDQFPASNLPEALPFQSISKLPGMAQFFVTKINTNNVKNGSIAYSTYFGGANFNPTPPATAPIATGGGITVDTNGNIYFTGTTNFTYTGCAGCQTTDFPILNAYQPCLDQPPPTVFVNPPTCTNTASTTSNSDAFVAKLNPNAVQGAQLLWSTYFGGSQTDSGTGIALDTGAANVFITGTTNSPDVTAVTTFAAYQPCLDNLFDPTTKACTATAPAANDAFVARLTNPATSTVTTNVSLTYFSYLGGSNNEEGLAIVVDSASGALVTGWTQSPANGTNPGGFPVSPNPNNIQGQLTGAQDAFVARLNTAAVVGQATTASWANFFAGAPTDPNTVFTEGTSIALDSNQVAYLAGDTNSSTLQVSRQLESYNGEYDAFVTQLTPTASLSIVGTLTLGTSQTYISAGNQATFTYTLTNGGPDPANTISVTDDISQQATGVALTFVSASATSGTCSGGGSTSTNVACSIQSLQSGSTATITMVLTPTPSNGGGAAKFNGGTVLASAANTITPATTSVSANMSDFSIAASPTGPPLQAAGDTATYQVQLTPHPVYNTNISLTCSGLPTGATCAFSTTPVTLTGTSPGSSTLNITTTARPVTLPAASLAPRHFYAIWLSVPGLALLGLGVGGGRRRRRTLGMLLLCMLFTMLLLQPACSTSSTQTPPSGTPAGTYPIIIAATAGSDTKNATISLNVP